MAPEALQERTLSKSAEVPDLCRACTGRHRGVCGALDGGQLRALAAASRKQFVKAGAELGNSATVSPTLANILSGVIKLGRTLPDGRQQIVGLQFAPDFLGRPFARNPGADVHAATDVVLCTFPRVLLESLISESPGLEHRLYAQALAELEDARDLLLSLGRKTAREKVASFLLLCLRNSGASGDDDGSLSLELPLKRTEIADFLGLTVETVSRQITAMQRDGVIETGSKRSVAVLKPDMLRAVSGD